MTILGNIFANRFILALAFCLLGFNSQAQLSTVSYSAENAVVTQNFDALYNIATPITMYTNSTGATVSTSLGPWDLSSAAVANKSALAGWQVAKLTGNTVAAATIQIISVSGGGSRSIAFFNIGKAGVGLVTDRAIGAGCNSALGAAIGTVFINNTGKTLTSFNLSYKGEQWYGSLVPYKLAFKYATGPTSTITDILKGTFTAVPALDFTTPNITGVTGDGNDAAYSTAISTAFSQPVFNINWLPGEALVLRWDYTNAFAQMAIDDVSFSAAADVRTYVTVPANDSNIVFRGLLYPIKSPTSVILNRFSSDFFRKVGASFSSSPGNTQSGIVLCFKTASPTVKVNFALRSDADLQGLVFAVYRNKVFLGNYTTLSFTLAAATTTTPTDWEVVLPIRHGVNFSGIEIEPNASLLPVAPEHKKTYISIGNSISHGVGQTTAASDATYPFQIAQAMDWRLYNLAVASSKVSPLVADQTTPVKADVITVLWGFNDWNWAQNMDTVATRYKTLLTKLRTYHPTATIYCILPIFTNKLLPLNGTTLIANIDTLRNTERRIAQQLL